MIRFTSIDTNKEEKQWEFESPKAIEREWWNEEYNLPDNDDEIIYVEENGENITEEVKEATYINYGFDALSFEDLLYYWSVNTGY